MNDWVWTSAVHSNQEKKMIFGGSNKGHIAMFDLEFMTVHGLYEDRYACRELMTDVIIQHMVTETRVKIRC